MTSPRSIYWILPTLLWGTLMLTALPAAPAYADAPCCGIVSFQPVDGIVVVRDLTTGRLTQMTVTDKALLHSLQVGQPVNLDAGGRIRLPAYQPVDGLRKRAGSPPRAAAELSPAASATRGVLASADGETSGTRIEVTQLKRNRGGTVTLKFVLVNDSDAELDTYRLLTAVEPHSDDGAALIDAVGKTKYFVLRDSDKHCLCSRNVQNPKPKSRLNLWAKFPAPAAGVDAISVVIPHFEPMDDVPISR